LDKGDRGKFKKRINARYQKLTAGKRIKVVYGIRGKMLKNLASPIDDTGEAN
jgi:hypothetical protein